MMGIRLAHATLVAVAFAVPAQAQTVLATNPASLVQALHSAGYSAVLGRDEQGDPKIDMSANGTNIIVYFLDCTGGRDCGAVRFHSSYDIAAPPLETMNRWNRDTRFARGYVLPDNDPVLEMDVNLDAPGGMSRRLFLDSVDRYLRLLTQFERLIGWGR